MPNDAERDEARQQFNVWREMYAQDLRRMQLRQQNLAEAPQPKPQRRPVAPQPAGLRLGILDDVGFRPVAQPELNWNDEVQIMPEGDFVEPEEEEVAQPRKRMEPVTFEKSTRLPRFKMKYENYDEARLRLSSTIITVNDRPVLVVETNRDRKEGGISLIVQTHDGIMDSVNMMAAGLDLRSQPPGYITMRQQAWYLSRVPARIYKQGLSKDNARVKRAGYSADDTVNAFAYGATELLKALEDRPVLQFTEEMAQKVLLTGKSQRLCDALALYCKSRAKEIVKVEYKGRDLGFLKGNTVIFDSSEDRQCSWIASVCNNVGLSVG